MKCNPGITPVETKADLERAREAFQTTLQAGRVNKVVYAQAAICFLQGTQHVRFSRPFNVQTYWMPDMKVGESPVAGMGSLVPSMILSGVVKETGQFGKNDLVLGMNISCVFHTSPELHHAIVLQTALLPESAYNLGFVDPSLDVRIQTIIETAE